MYSSKVYWLSEPKKSEHLTILLEINPKKSMIWLGGGIPVFFYLISRQTQKHYIVSDIYIYPIISLYHHDVPLHHQILHHLNTFF